MQLLACEVSEVALNEDDGGSSVAASAGQIAKASEQVGKSSRGGSLSLHTADHILILLTDS